ncbi:MAG: DUF1127 domain-containing protein [Rhodospirillales bacterium]|jgi:uncharacterized protein YjiS (DUF1127 family)|nr:DUF1127 domain-containing protein [Rhodospirillales bacterium]
MSTVGTRRHDAEGLARAPRAPVVRTLASALRSAGLTLALWSQRSQQRRCLRELPAPLLADVGLSEVDVVRETRKHFWQE